MKILALDLGKFKSVSCCFDTEAQTTEYWTLCTDRPYLTTVLQEHQPELVVIEACSIAAWVHDLCGELGFRILVCNPNQEAWRWKNVKRKTDRDDALKLAKLGALGQLTPVHIPARATREHRWLVKYRKTIVGRMNRVQNILRALFQQHGLPLPVGARCWTCASLEAIAAQSKPLTDCGPEELWRGQLAQELAAYHQLHSELAELERKLTALAEQDERIALLETIPGVGRVTAEIIATHLDRPERFTNARQVSSYAGLVPRQYQSGLMDRQGGITRRGSRLLRSALVECAWAMLLQRLGTGALPAAGPRPEEPQEESDHRRGPQAARALLGHAARPPAVDGTCRRGCLRSARRPGGSKEIYLPPDVDHAA